jgi:hypothetical protein
MSSIPKTAALRTPKYRYCYLAPSAKQVGYKVISLTLKLVNIRRSTKVLETPATGRVVDSNTR